MHEVSGGRYQVRLEELGSTASATCNADVGAVVDVTEVSDAQAIEEAGSRGTGTSRTVTASQPGSTLRA